MEPFKVSFINIFGSVARKSGVLRHFLGHNLFEDHTYDVITYGSLGRVSSIALDGTIHWQVCITVSSLGIIFFHLHKFFTDLLYITQWQRINDLRMLERSIIRKIKLE